MNSFAKIRSGFRETPTLTEAAEALSNGQTTSRALVELCLANIDNNANARASYTGDFSADRARQYADAADRIRARGYHATQWAGVPVSVKDSFDVKGQVTAAGSQVWRNRAPATQDAAVVTHLRRAGFIVLGRTQMTEFAQTGLGLNPHGPQPYSASVDDDKAVPGGSTSGGAVSVACGAALGCIGSDAGGSSRIPAAFNGLVGFKPTSQNISSLGMATLSPSLDSVGMIAKTVSDCSVLNFVVQGKENLPHLPDSHLNDLHFVLPTTHLHHEADPLVLSIFEAVVAHLQRAGAKITRKVLPALQDIVDLDLHARLVAAEAYHYFHDVLISHPTMFDPRTSESLLKGEETTVKELRRLYLERERLTARFASEIAPYDAMVSPTVPIQPPTLAACADPALYGRFNRLVLRNPSVANVVDGCSISLPLNWKGLPTGLMLTASQGKDAQLLGMARSFESIL